MTAIKTISPEEWDERIAKFNCKWLETVEFAYNSRLAECLKCEYQFKIVAGSLATRKRDTVCPYCLGEKINEFDFFFKNLNPGSGGFNFTKPAVLYVLDHPMNMTKVGVTNTDVHDRKGRIAQHYKNGWRLYKFWKMNTGLEAHDVEQKIVKEWRKEMNFPPAIKDMDGWTETVDQKCISIDEICSRIEDLV